MDLGPFPDASGYDRALQLDDIDPLAGFRSRYVIDEPGLIYLDGNSLGRLPEAGLALVEQVARDDWGHRLIRSWNEGWWDLQVELGDRLAPVIGASAGEVIVSDSTSVNLYKLAMAAKGALPDRNRIVTDDMNFPTDVYVLDSVARAHDAVLEIVPTGGLEDPADAIEAALDRSTALVSLSHTMFKSGYTYDLSAITKAAHRVGALTLWDLSHSVGAMPIELHRSDADLAVGCTYKYLNGGPGSPAFLFVRADLQAELANPIAAWWGHADPFAFDLEFRPVATIRKFHTGTMPILSLAPIAAGISDVLDAGIDRIRAKSVSLGEFLITQSDEHLAPLGFSLGSPRDSGRRGSHVSLTHPEALAITRAIIDLGHVIPDFRAPDSMRFGLAPLYTTHLEIHTAVQRLRLVVESGGHAAFTGASTFVT